MDSIWDLARLEVCCRGVVPRLGLLRRVGGCCDFAGSVMPSYCVVDDAMCRLTLMRDDVPDVAAVVERLSLCWCCFVLLNSGVAGVCRRSCSGGGGGV